MAPFPQRVFAHEIQENDRRKSHGGMEGAQWIIEYQEP
jgi:hypothetical protein